MTRMGSSTPGSSTTATSLRPVDHFLKFFRQLPGLSNRVLTEPEWLELLAITDRTAFEAKVKEYFSGLPKPKQARMAQFLYDKNQELLREMGVDMDSGVDAGTEYQVEDFVVPEETS